MSPDFLEHYEREQLPCSPSAKANHWKTWQAAQAALLAATGPAVEMRYLHEAGPIDEAAWMRLGRKG